MHQESMVIPKLDVKKSTKIICNFIRGKLKESKAEGLVIGLSGGIDSSIVAYLCASAAETDNIIGLILPSETTPTEDIRHAVDLAEKLGIKYEILNIDELIKPYQEICPQCKDSTIANGNLKARIRMIILYYHANSMNRLVAGTGNRTELLIGYFTKYGDGGVDILPIGDLYKTDVREIAKYLGVSEDIIEKAPTAGLWVGQTDERELGIKYELLDKILYLMIDKNLSSEEVAEKLNISENEVLRIKSKVERSKHKLSSPAIAEIR